MANWLQAVQRIIAGESSQQTSWAWVDRQSAYELWSAYYSNSVYEPTTQGGQREFINATLGNASAADLAGLYNPVGAAVDLYLNVFGGAFGQEITIDAASPALQAAIDQIWKWSNLTIEKQPLCRLAAMHGTVGLRIVARPDRVYLKVEHPRIIRDKEEDDRGNVTAIQLEYEVTTGLAEQAVTVTIREELTREWIRTWRMDGGIARPFDLTTMTDGGPGASYPNALGVVPYVVVRHEHVGDDWGRNAFYRARTPLDRLNALISHINTQIHRHVRAKWLVAASGDPPSEFDLTDMTIAYVNTRGGASAPVIQPMIAPLNLADAIATAQMEIGIIEDLLPELKATQGKFLSGQSGETIAQLRKPAEDRILLARSNYEDALVRAQQIAVSWMILYGLCDLGTGTESKEAADRAYRSGAEDHAFVKRPAFVDDSAKVAAPAPAVEAMPTDPMMNEEGGNAG